MLDKISLLPAEFLNEINTILDTSNKDRSDYINDFNQKPYLSTGIYHNSFNLLNNLDSEIYVLI